MLKSKKFKQADLMQILKYFDERNRKAEIHWYEYKDKKGNTKRIRMKVKRYYDE